MSVLLAVMAVVAQVPATDGTGLIVGGPRVEYQQWKIGRIEGYKEKKLAADRWQVDAQSGRLANKDMALLSTLYRSAVITKAAGYSRFFTTKLEIQNELASYIVASNSVYGQNVYSTIVLHDDATAPPVCEAKPKWAENCRDNSADEIIATVGPILGQDAAALGAEIKTARAKYYAR